MNNNYPKAIQKLVDLFSRFPTVGPRTASRFVYYFIKMPEPELNDFLDSVKKLRENIKICPSCFNTFDPSQSSESICEICSDKTRNRKLLCLVEKEADLEAIENTKTYKGLYFIINGTIGIKGSQDKIRIEELKEKIKNSDFQEIIIAINPTPEGERTSLFVERELKKSLPSLPKITHLGRGLPIGGELEYADSETLENSFQGRK